MLDANILLSGTFLQKVMGWTSEDTERIRDRTRVDLDRKKLGLVDARQTVGNGF